MEQGYERYLLADPVFYDDVSRWGDRDSRFEITDLPAPEGWQRTERNPWIVLRPADSHLPEQGWKIHVAAQPRSAGRVGRIVWDHCTSAGLAFKFLRNRNVVIAHNAKYAPRGVSGKFCTIYPADEAALHKVLAELGGHLAGEAAPNILSDLRWGPGPLFTRYGGFVEKHFVDERGDLKLAITDREGKLQPDLRGAVFAPPSWVSLPAFLIPHRDARRTPAGAELPYRVTEALHFSNGGGVYLAKRLTDGARVILKEARPLAGLDINGHDAVTRLRRERWALETLAGVTGVPACHDYITVGEHEFLVEEFIDGEPLQRWPAHAYPLVLDVQPGREKIADYTGRALRIYRELTDLIARLHARGVTFGDLHPGNLMLRPDGSLALVDFELVRRIGDEEDAGLNAFGFVGAHGSRRGVARDRYGVAATGLWLFLPLNRVLALAPEKSRDYLDFVAERFPVPIEFVEQLHHQLYDAGATAPASGGAKAVIRLSEPIVDWAAAQRSMAAAILLSATPGREDRLFPGDISQFGGHALGFAHGAGGILWALSVTGHGRHPSLEERLVAELARPGWPRPGFYDGLHGYAYLADHFGRSAEAGALLERAISAMASVRSVDLYNGLAGAGLNLLHFAHRTGDTRLRDEAQAIADKVIQALDQRDDADPVLPSPDRAGLMWGWSGPALFLLRLAIETGDKGYLDLATRAIHRDLDECVAASDGSLQVGGAGGRVIPYLEVGSAGIALVIDELLDHRSDERLDESLAPLLRACSVEFVMQPNLTFGRAGLLAALSRAGRRLDEDLRPTLARHLHRLDWHAVSYRGHTAFPGNELLRLSMDLATGTAGVLLAVHAATAATSRFLPFFDQRPGWCGRGVPAQVLS
jgi:tRNA A-37 threonylcarbamoyl transferase component Bud32